MSAGSVTAGRSGREHAGLCAAVQRGSLAAQVVGRTALFYGRGADASLDRPAHVRAGSALTRLGPDRLAVVQDDASFIAIVELAGAAEATGAGAPLVVRDIPLPSADGIRQFDDGRGNKHAKLDLEACFATSDASLLIAFGSGSTPARERVVLIEQPGGSAPQVCIVEAHALYAAMRAERVFCGSELNVEGAALAGDDVLLLQRGNGACNGELSPADASARIALGPLLDYLRALARAGVSTDGLRPPCPPLRDVVSWDLGAAQGTRLTFTDAVSTRGRWTGFLACAEASPDATRDGPVSGVAIGRLDDRTGEAELALIVDERGEPLLDKAEGIALDDRDPQRAWLVVDRDDAASPAELLELRLGEGWTT